MIALLTWPTYGHWLRGPGRGCCDAGDRDEGAALPEPDLELSRRRQRSLKWPAVRLSAPQRTLILDDLVRIARLRRFRPLVAVAAADHVHLLLDRKNEAALPRLIQLIKGSLSRTLSVAEGDPAAVSTSGSRLPHHKWWTAQYSLRIVGNPDETARARALLSAHDAVEAEVRSNWPADLAEHQGAGGA